MAFQDWRTVITPRMVVQLPRWREAFAAPAIVGESDPPVQAPLWLRFDSPTQWIEFDPRMLSAILRAPEIRGVVCPDLHVLWRLFQKIDMRPGSPELLLTRPPTTPAEARLIAECSEKFRLTVLIDHFVHAQLLAEWMRGTSRTCELLIVLRDESPNFGVRMGRFASDLWLGSRRMEHVDITGVATELSDRIFEAFRGRREPKSAEVDVPHYSEWCSRFVLLNEAETRPEDPHLGTAFEKVISFEQWLSRKFPRSEMENGHGQAPVSVIASVISRPKLDHAVLDCGQRVIDEPHNFACRDFGDVSLVSLSAERSVWQLGESAQRLRIGDRVEFTLLPTEKSLYQAMMWGIVDVLDSPV